MSFIWAGLHTAKDTLLSGFRWVVGDGAYISATKDHWLGTKNNFHVEQDHMYAGRTETCLAGLSLEQNTGMLIVLKNIFTRLMLRLFQQFIFLKGL